jgi:hypothetical protein
VVSGYSGGHVVNPTYEQVCTGTTGHAEVVQLTFDPQVVSFQEISDVFFSIHDPTTLNRQGADVGPQYRSTIFYHDEAQRATAEPVIAELEAAIVEDILLGLSVAAPIGPTNVEMIRRGLRSGFWACVRFALGVDVALIAYLAAIFAGLSFLAEIEWFNTVLSVFGVVVLFYLGHVSIKDFFDRADLDLEAGGRRTGTSSRASC